MPCGQGYLRFPRLTRRRARDRAGLPLSRDRAQIERGLYGAEERVAERERDRLPHAAHALPQFPNEANEKCRLRQRVFLISRRRRRLLRTGLLARRDGAAELLRADRSGTRG